MRNHTHNNMEDVDRALIEYLRCQGKSYKDISECLQAAYPNNRGFSARSVRRYCVLHRISKLSDSEVDDIIGDAVKEVRLYSSIPLNMLDAECIITSSWVIPLTLFLIR